jgi:hypothetical protein
MENYFSRKGKTDVIWEYKQYLYVGINHDIRTSETARVLNTAQTFWTP